MGALAGQCERHSRLPWISSTETRLTRAFRAPCSVSAPAYSKCRRIDYTSMRIRQQCPLSCASSCGPEGLSTEDVPVWNECVDILVNDIGMSREIAEKTMLRGFGWGSQAYWRQELVQEPPSVDAIQACLDYLTTHLGMESNVDKAKVLEKFPEVLKVDQALMEENVRKLEKNFFLKGKALTKSIARKPKVLGATTDCQGDCAGDCTRCFAQF